MFYDFSRFYTRVEDPPIENTLKKIELYAKSIQMLHDEIEHLKSEQNLAITHLKQYQADFNQLRNMYNKVSRKLQSTTPNKEDSQIIRSCSEYRVELTRDIPQNYTNLQFQILANDTFYKSKSNVRLVLSYNNVQTIKSAAIDDLTTRLAFTDGNSLTLLNLENRTFINSVLIPDNTSVLYNKRSVMFTPNGQYICLSIGPKLLLYLANNLKLCTEISLDESKIISIQFSTDLDLLILAYENGILSEFQLSTLEPIKTYKCEFEGTPQLILTGMEIKGNNLRVSSDMGVMVTLKIPQFSLVSINNTGSRIPYGFVSSPNSERFITLSNQSDSKKDDDITYADFSTDGSLFVTASVNFRLTVWETKTMIQLFSIVFHQNTITDLRHSKNKPLFVSVSADGYICLWEYTKKE
ncbi:hypothetical protein TVAG_424910 [Trichomonas vaginalis G3]|uniref:Uncharacterized protein n=1 Tax=Trichomonas vaginalis (strain ATCC PRA-98 / G3) TaxID=412133 RepID=A2F5E1_TRIV3|nr:WD40 repeat-like family [Trichomonas vaginalis G3]EAX99854.1 hypothetical protein TVAG_424910 [Trichomonas vaginalis G3]KAI5549605.1 WD40 repeat-like family [Trichomonas vaginalis G3]|eukprot:XP_001312784.1 hypothetical protein [Trichomonas vaginalis G3]